MKSLSVLEESMVQRGDIHTERHSNTLGKIRCRNVFSLLWQCRERSCEICLRLIWALNNVKLLARLARTADCASTLQFPSSVLALVRGCAWLFRLELMMPGVALNHLQ